MNSRSSNLPVSNLPVSTRRLGLFAGLYLAIGLSTVSAQTDTLYPLTGNPVRGTVTNVSRDGVVMKTGQTEQTFFPGQITKIVFQGDPAALTRGREAVMDGQYDQALEELRTIDLNKITRDAIKQDAIFYRIMSEANLALAGQGDKNKAIASAMEFASSNRDSWHFYGTAKLLGDLALALKNYDRAIQYYGSLRSAPSAEAKVEMRYLIGMTHLRKGDLNKAQDEFESVAGVNVASPAVTRLKTLALAGKAVTLARSGKADEGVALATGLIEELDPSDAELAARIYNALGASHVAAGDAEGAVLAYLHTHLLFSSLPDAHAEALSQLMELWGTIGHADRAEEVRQELMQRYPGYADIRPHNRGGMGGMSPEASTATGE